jgi:hypothetical protein
MKSDLPIEPNVFQRLMLHWERFAPYNAGQVLTLNRTTGLAQAAAAWRRTVVGLGLQQAGQHPDAPLVEPSVSLQQHVTTELNRRFTHGDSPFRPFLIRSGDVTHVGLIYRHVLADSASIRGVVDVWLRELLGDYPQTSHIRLATAGRSPLWKPWKLIGETFGELSRLSRIKRVRRLPRTNDPASDVVWIRVDLPDGLIDSLRDSARRRGVRVNDLFLTAIARSAREFVPHEHFDHRQDLAVGTIVDLRSADTNAIASFGLSLGFLQTFWRWQDLTDRDQTLASAAAQSKRARESSAASASLLRLRAALWQHGRRGLEELSDFYRKRCPLAAGVSNVNLNRSGFRALHPSPLKAYTRISPLGPMLPVVFTPTTLGNTLNLGFTYRANLISRQVAELLVGRFTDELNQLV